MKRVIAGIMALTLCLSVMPASLTAWAAEEEAAVLVEAGEATVPEGFSVCEQDGFMWKIDGSTLYLNGEGEMYDYHRISDVPWNDNITDITKVVVGEGVTKLGQYSFSGGYNITDVSLPESLTVIGYMAFQRCAGLVDIKIPESVTKIDRYAFNLCTGLPQITLPKSLEYIGPDAFSQCTSLETVNFTGNALTEICSNAFQRDDALKSIDIPDGIVTIGSSAFSSCTNLETVKLGSTITALNPAIFINCSSLKSFTCTGELTKIGDNCFMNCTKLAELNITPGTVKEVGASAFYMCTSLNDISALSGAETVGKDAFYRCGSKDMNTDAETLFSFGTVYVTPDEAGQVVSIPLNITGNKSFGRARIKFMYDSNLEYVDTRYDKMGWIYMERTGALESIILGECYTEEDGTLAVVSFRVPESLSVGDSFDVYVTDYSEEDSEAPSITDFGGKAGSITVAKSAKPDDMNGDGTVNVADIVSMSRYITKQTSTFRPNRGDLSGDGKVNVIDLCILKSNLL